ncbi:MAG: chemotaxis protein CheB [Bacteroidota bacterium]
MMRYRCVIIGSSTGGQSALAEILPGLSPSLGVPILVIQHNLKGMSDFMVSSLQRLTSIPVKEAKGGEILVCGQSTIYVAPSGYHMRIIWNRDHNPMIVVREGKGNPNLLPNIDETMTTASEVFNSSVLGVILTGMGSDGTEGMKAIWNAGGTTLAQDPATCAIPSMPASAIAAGVVTYVVGLQYMAGKINYLVLSKA